MLFLFYVSIFTASARADWIRRSCAKRLGLHGAAGGSSGPGRAAQRSAELVPAAGSTARRAGPTQIGYNFCQHFDNILHHIAFGVVQKCVQVVDLEKC